MFYGDQESNYTQMRASYGPFGGAMAGGAYAQMAMGGAYYGPGMPPPGSEGAGSMLAQIGGMVRPATYMPPARAFAMPSGQYIQPQQTLAQSFGTMIGWNETPRNMSTLDYRMNTATDFAERTGAAGTAGATTAAGVALGTMLTPAGTLVGKYVGAGVGGAIGSMLGPVGTGVGAVVGGAVGGFAGGIAAYGLGTAASATALDLMNQQRNVRNFLETTSFRYATASTEFSDPRFASGMSTKGRGQVAEMLTKMDVKDPYLDMDELSRILQGATSAGLMNNTRSMDDFKRKFKDIADNVKTLARTFNTTLEEGLKVMKDFRGIGITEAGEVSKLSMRADAMGRVTGRTAREMVEVGMQGAEMYRGTGISMNIGFQAAQMNLTSIRAARDAGILSQEAVAQAGGEEALAQRMTAGGVGFLQSMQGRGTMAGFFTGGGFNSGSFREYLGGNTDLPSFALQAARNLGTPEELLRYQARQPKVLSEMGKQFGGLAPQLAEMGTAMMQAQYLRKQMPGLSQEDAFRVSLQGLGKSEPEIDTMLATINNAQNEFTAKQKGAAATRDREVAERAYSNFFFTRAYDKYIKDPLTSLKNTIAAPINRSIDNFVESTKDTWERHGLGVEKADISGIKLSVGSAPTAEEIRAQVVSGGLSFSKGQVDLDKGGAFAQTAGEALAAQEKAIERNFGIKAGGSEGEVIVDRRSGVRAAVGVGAGLLGGGILGYAAARAVGDKSYSQKQISRMGRVSQIYVASGDMAAIEKEAGFSAAYSAAHRRATQADLKGLSGLELIKTLSGKNEDELTKMDYAVARKLADGLNGVEAKALDEFDNIAMAAKDIGAAVSVESMQSAKEKYGAAKDKMTKTLFGEEARAAKEQVSPLGGGALSNLFKAKTPELAQEDFNKLLEAKTTKDPEKRQALLDELAVGVANQTQQEYRTVRKNLESRLGKIDEKEAIAAVDEMKRIQAGRYTEAKVSSLSKGIEKLKDEGKTGSVAAIGEVKAALESGDITALISKGTSFKKDLLDIGEGALVQQISGLDSVGKAVEQFKKDGKADALSKAIEQTGLVSKEAISGYVAAARSDDKDIIKNIQNTIFQGQKELEAGATAVSGSGGPLQAGGGDPQEAFRTQVAINSEILGILRGMQAQLAGRR